MEDWAYVRPVRVSCHACALTNGTGAQASASDTCFPGTSKYAMQAMRFPNRQKVHDRTPTYPNGVLSQDIVLYVCMIGHREQLQVAGFNVLVATGIVKIPHPGWIVTTRSREQAKLRSLLTGEIKHVPHDRPQFWTCRCRPQKSCAPRNNMFLFHEGNGITKNSPLSILFCLFILFPLPSFLRFTSQTFPLLALFQPS